MNDDAEVIMFVINIAVIIGIVFYEIFISKQDEPKEQTKEGGKR